MTNIKHNKILLGLLPFWTPQIPPLGISCLKSTLQKNGYDVKAADLNTVDEFRSIYNNYFATLRELIPGKRQGNFFNIGTDVLRNHMMAHINYEDEDEYNRLIKLLIYNIFYTDAHDIYVSQLKKIISGFYETFEKYFLDLLEKEKPSVLGLSVYSGTLPTSLFAFKLTRKRYPGIKTVMGGGVFADQLKNGSPNFDYLLEKTEDYIDHFIIGEGEILFLKLLAGTLDGSKRFYTVKDIDDQWVDVSTADVPDLSDFTLQDYPTPLSYWTSRSCPFQCSFCSETVQWGKYRKKSAAQVVQETVQMFEEYGSQMFLMGDSLLNPIATELAEEYAKTGPPIYWDGYLRADKPVCDPENAFRWRRGGFYRARLGVESGSQNVLDLMEKKITPSQIKDAITTLAAEGIKTTTYWVIGHPGETEEDFRQTLDLIEDLKNDIYEAECNPFNYFPSGQVHSEDWMKEHKRLLLYPESAKDMLVTQTWILDYEPDRETIFQRIVRFVEHCQNLGIPNPYSLNDIHRADERWKRLHNNAVPSLLDFKSRNSYVDECRNVKQRIHLEKKLVDDGNFNF